MQHPLQLFTKLVAKEKIFPDAEFKEALSLLNEKESKQYSEIRDKGLAAIQLTPDEEKAVEAILKVYPSQNFNFKAYAELLFLTRLACKKEENQGAELHAVKLALMFSDTQKAVDYLVKFQNSRKKERKQLIHDACLFNPPTGNLNFPLWQTFAIKFMPNKDFETLLPHAEKIQNYVKEKRSDYEKEIWNDLISKYEVKLSSEYDQKQLTEEGYIKEKMKLSASKIAKDISKALDTWAKSELNITDKKLNPVQQRQINQFCDEKGQAEKKRLTEEINKRYQNKFKKEYKTVSPNSLKSDSIKQQLDDLRLLYNKPPDLTAESKSSGMRRILEDNFKTSANKIYSEVTDLETLLDYAANVSYARSKEKPAVAKLFFSLGLQEESFNKYLELKPCDDEMQIPNIFIDGEALGYPEFYLKKLSPFDPRAAVLGKLTSCCQSLGNQGEPPAIYGIESPHAGFYILCKKTLSATHESDRILSQCLAWKGQQGNMVFDSIETQVNFREKYESIVIDFFLYLAHRLTSDYDVSFVLAGTGGQTPDNIGKKVPNDCVELTKDYNGYSDAKEQIVVAIKNISLVKNLAIQNKSTEKYLKNLETKNSDPINYDRQAIRKIMRMMYEVNSDSVNKETFIDELLIVGRQLNLTRELLSEELDIILDYGSIYYKDDSHMNKDTILRLIKAVGIGLGDSKLKENIVKSIENSYHSSDFEIQKKYLDRLSMDFKSQILFAAIVQEYATLVKSFVNPSEKNYLDSLMEYAAHIYPRSKENPNAAKLFFSFGIDNKSFNKYVDLKPCDDDKLIPNILIEGGILGDEQFYVKKLSSTDIRAAVLERLTGSGESIDDKHYSDIVTYGIENPYAGFYILCQKTANKPSDSDPILAHCLAWRSRKGNIVLERIESKYEFRQANTALIINIFLYLAHRLVSDFNIPLVMIGTHQDNHNFTGKTIPECSYESAQGTHDYRIKNYHYGAHTQKVIAIRGMSLTKCLAQEAKVSKTYLSKLFDVENPSDENVNLELIRKIIRFNEYETRIISKDILVDELLKLGKKLKLSRTFLTDEIQEWESIKKNYALLSSKWTSDLQPDELIQVVKGIGLGLGNLKYKNEIYQELEKKLDFIEFKKEYFDKTDTDFKNELLLIAIKNNKPKLIQFFIENKLVDINAELDNEGSFLKSAVRYTNTDTVKYLVKCGAKTDDKSLFSEAISSKKLESAKYIKEIQKDVDFFSIYSYESPIASAIFNNDITAVQYLLEIKLDINKKYKYYSDAEYPLFFAAKNNREQIVEFLLKFTSFIWSEQDNLYFEPPTSEVEILKLLRDEREKYIPVSQMKIVTVDNLTAEEQSKLYANFQEKGKQLIEQESKNHESTIKKIFASLNFSYYDFRTREHHKYFQILLGMEKINLKIMIQLCENEKGINFVKSLSYAEYFSKNGIRLFEKNYISFFELLDTILLDDPSIYRFIEAGGDLVCDKSINFRVRHFSELSVKDKYDVKDILLSPKGKEVLKHDLINVHEFLKIDGTFDRKQFIDNLNIEEKIAERKAKSNSSLKDVSIFSETKQENLQPPDTAEQPKQKP